MQRPCHTLPPLARFADLCAAEHGNQLGAPARVHPGEACAGGQSGMPCQACFRQCLQRFALPGSLCRSAVLPTADCRLQPRILYTRHRHRRTAGCPAAATLPPQRASTVMRAARSAPASTSPSLQAARTALARCVRVCVWAGGEACSLHAAALRGLRRAGLRAVRHAPGVRSPCNANSARSDRRAPFPTCACAPTPTPSFHIQPYPPN